MLNWKSEIEYSNKIKRKRRKERERMKEWERKWKREKKIQERERMFAWVSVCEREGDIFKVKFILSQCENEPRKQVLMKWRKKVSTIYNFLERTFSLSDYSTHPKASSLHYYGRGGTINGSIFHLEWTHNNLFIRFSATNLLSILTFCALV